MHLAPVLPSAGFMELCSAPRAGSLLRRSFAPVFHIGFFSRLFGIISSVKAEIPLFHPGLSHRSFAMVFPVGFVGIVLKMPRLFTSVFHVGVPGRLFGIVLRLGSRFSSPLFRASVPGRFFGTVLSMPRLFTPVFYTGPGASGISVYITDPVCSCCSQCRW